MSLKAELETWAAALKAYDEEDFDKSLQLFSNIADSSKILTNMGLIYATIGEHEAAVEQFAAATQLDQYLAVAYFQSGVSSFLLGAYPAALQAFDDALLYMRGNADINYAQLGLKFTLYAAEVLFNKGLTLIYMSREGYREDGRVGGRAGGDGGRGELEGMAVLEEARREARTEEHAVIADAIRDGGDGYTVFSIPVGVLYRPAEKKLQNAKAKDYMGKAKLVAAEDASEAYTEFTGVARMRMGQGLSPTRGENDRPRSPSGLGLGLGRANTLGTPAVPLKRDDDIMPSLQRSKTTINVSAPSPRALNPNAISPRSNSPSTVSPVRSPPTVSPVRSASAGPRAGAGSGLSRSATSVRRGGANGPGPGPVRGLSVRKPGLNASSVSGNGNGGGNGGRAEARGRANANETMRTTEFYESYLDGYAEEPLPPLPQPRRANTAPSSNANSGSNANANGNANANAGPGVRRANTTRAPANSVYSNGSGMGGAGGGVRRRPTRRPTMSRRVVSEYEEDEEGYGSGEWEEGPGDLMKIRVKLHYQDDVRGMAFTPDMPWEEFLERVTGKFGRALDGLGMKFKDEDGGKVSLKDGMDYELAIETAREMAKGKLEGRLEIWCVDE
ncbi:uncharacterized protein LAESUDRAFT_727636 [Laetiporus sulphureus 93-53]|uniref:PB1 domain-containing protein n=1 Tax=Laetiporus sulphureus 93-53 TaxID=1314785 RepID=A0A165DFF2_9APHY|nr:uncharacterized protein LAESUDRAFT_727636 [Laetiporus sulphureus 93-53]KZT04776.1 hypothetical protein LAESUDRAFT_727636 [Laetiporus sulphureus 93-53]